MIDIKFLASFQIMQILATLGSSELVTRQESEENPFDAKLVKVAKLAKKPFFEDNRRAKSGKQRRLRGRHASWKNRGGK